MSSSINGNAGTVSAASLVAPTLALRRTAASASSALLWECNETTSPLASTGSVACSLANAGAATLNFIDALSTLDGGALRSSGAANSDVVGGAGVYPDSATTTAVTMWALINIHTMPTGFTAGMTVCRDYAITGGPWAPPYGTAIMIRASGTVTGAGVFGAVPTYDEVSSAAGAVEINRQHLVGMTYNGSTLRVWVDGVLVASKAVAAPLTWGSAGSWHLAGSGNGDLLNGVVMRAGVENTVWSQTDWARAYRRLTGNTSDL